MGRGRQGATDEWQELLPLFGWPERHAYEGLRPLVLFDSPVAERATYRRVERFEKNGMLGLFATDDAGRPEAPKPGGYAPRRPAGPAAPRGVLFPNLDAL